MQSSTDVLLMKRALQIARMGEGKVAPNPLVGCVLVHPEYGIIGEGWHQIFGGPHAEVNAIRSVQNEDWLRESTAYVTLEPCSHFGKTPPCADLLIERGIPRVVICNMDPNPLVAGKGIEKLRSAGIEVQTGILEKEGAHLNRFFLTSFQKKRPFITLKWAQTSDGFIAREDGSSKWISSAESRLRVHKWRAEHQAILVGSGTLQTDDPFLTVRGWKGRSPVRIILDPDLKLHPNLNVFTDQTSKTWVFNQVKEESAGHLTFKQLKPPGFTLSDVLDILQKAGIQSLFVEGGSRMIQSFIEAGLWDEACVFKSPVSFGSGTKAPALQNHLLVTSERSGSDILETYHPQ
ncbi:MAG TPA: bifunctional diaminohydroxyphosphoribosylaminopyrimidine deaminase/5-amino-6-(5-phosphoribosylamino)uracil reductase RibD [Catalimonadaceae bacterium]|nr:bifunctional diaminohydroxyphosphoribosylaminopyrimidine deaminase/5-amino-6-(5-phosphoribosylamino)uracil reductase RibD [Catalimonadaceae bacterium]